MRNRASLFPLLALTLSCALGVQAQETPTPNDTTSFTSLASRGDYDELYSLADETIKKWEAAEKVAPRDIYYWRGVAALNIGWFARSRADLERIKSTATPAQLPAIEKALKDIAAIETVLPPQVYDVTKGDDVIFRVHYTQDDPMTRSIIEALPLAYNINSQVMGTYVIQQPVFIFNTYDQFLAFYQLRGKKAPGSWAWATGGRSSFQFCLQKPNGQFINTSSEDYIRSTVVHEYNHTVMARAMGNVILPKWFVEGFASYVGSMATQDGAERNQRKIARLFAGNALVRPSILENSAQFKDHTELGLEMKRQGANAVSPDPYGQSQHMATYLVSNMKAGQLTEFLESVRDKRSFEQGLQDQFGVGLQEFYASWYQDTLRSLN